MVLQTTLFTHLRIDGVAPDVGLVAVLAVAYEDGADTGAIFGFVMGLAIDLFLTTPLGLSALSFAITGYAVGVFQAGHGAHHALAGAPPRRASAGSSAASCSSPSAPSSASPASCRSTACRIVLIASIYDAVIATVVFPVVRRAARHDDSPSAWRVRG